jgi:hypothetical protein
MQNGLRTQAMRMPSCAFRMVMAFKAEGVRFVVAVQEAHHLLYPARNAQDGVGDVGFAGTADLQCRPSLSKVEVPANSTPRIRA